MTITQYFQTLTGFPPRQFQRQAIAHLLNRQDVLLRAPTGSGKTETAIAPFLFAKTLQCDFPNKLIYVVPLRTLANSLRQRAETLARTWETFIEERRGEGETRRRGEFYTDIPVSPCPRVSSTTLSPSCGDAANWREPRRPQI